MLIYERINVHLIFLNKKEWCPQTFTSLTLKEKWAVNKLRSKLCTFTIYVHLYKYKHFQDYVYVLLVEALK